MNFHFIQISSLTERRKKCLDNDVKCTFFYSYKLCRRCHETFKSVVVFLLLLFVRKNTGHKNKNQLVFSVKTLNFLAVFFISGQFLLTTDHYFNPCARAPMLVTLQLMVWTGHLTDHLTASSSCHCLEISSGWIVGMHMTKNHYISVTKTFLVIQNNSLSLECINKINKRKDGKQISTFDFSALIQFLIYVLLYV